MISVRKLKTFLAATIAISALAISSPTRAQDFYRGKRITMVAGLALVVRRSVLQGSSASSPSRPLPQRPVRAAVVRASASPSRPSRCAQCGTRRGWRWQLGVQRVWPSPRKAPPPLPPLASRRSLSQCLSR